ncbi:membrane protein insertion efficiency factor YidD [Thermodesulfatator indicus]
MRKIVIKVIKIYQLLLSPFLPQSCRFYPTCSHYAIEAISKFGVIKGLILACFRLMRCHPLCKGGYDPVPERFPSLWPKKLNKGVISKWNETSL